MKSSPFKKLGDVIESLLGAKSSLTSDWVESVKHIIDEFSSNSCHSPATPATVGKCFCHEDDDHIASLEGELALLKVAKVFSNINRRLALNKLLDLKGNIRVFCRMRPLFSSEQQNDAILNIGEDDVHVLVSDKDKAYKFDKVFQTISTQEEVFSEVEPFIKSALEGHNVCIFAYGQTGTGKTFTMEGGKDCRGIVPRTIQQLFQNASTHKVKLSMLEVYQGSLRDLLLPRSNQVREQATKSVSIQRDASGLINIENLTEIAIQNAAQGQLFYQRGTRARSTSQTTANQASSRSHCIVRLIITSPHGSKNKLWLLDLGGSDCFCKGQTSKKIQGEGRALNVSLSALGDVIFALERRAPYIPYRNSKLTQVFQACLEKGSKTLMMVHISPKKDDLAETVSSLEIASTARGICLSQDAKGNAALIEDALKKMKEYETECETLSKRIHGLEEILDEKKGSQTTSGGSSGKFSKHNNLPRFMMPTISSNTKKFVSENKCGLSIWSKEFLNWSIEKQQFPLNSSSPKLWESRMTETDMKTKVNRTLNFDVLEPQ